MFVVTEADAAAIRAIFEQEGELSAAIELRRRFPGVTDTSGRGNAPGPDGARQTLLGFETEAPNPGAGCLALYVRVSEKVNEIGLSTFSDIGVKSEWMKKQGRGPGVAVKSKTPPFLTGL
jgi:hypothetical protein